MNRIFKLVWNATLNTWVVASELATGKTKPTTVGANRVATTTDAPAMGDRKQMSSLTKLAAAVLVFGTGSINVAYAGNTCLVNGVWVTAPLASGDKALACGEGASASQVNDLALGAAAKANGAIDADGHIGGAIAIGQNSSAQMYNAIALGDGSSAFGSQSMALGQGAVSGVSGNTSIVKSLALGFSAVATEGYTVAIGSGTKATGYSAVGIGNAPVASGTNAVALGTWTTASGYNSTGIGNIAVASNSGATAIGDRAKASGSSAIALGTATRAEGSTSISIGAQNVVTGSNSGAIGTGLTFNFDGVSGNNSYSLGNGNTISNDNTFVVGNNVTTTQGNSVVLGNNSTDRAMVATPTGIINGTTYNYAGGSPSGVVSVGSVNGERQIINVAAGQVSTTSTDAINGSQLYATNQAISAVDADAVKYDDSTHNTITLGGSTYDNSTHIGGTSITNVADGKAPSDAVNYSQLTETNNSITNLGDNVSNIYNQGTKYFHANSTGTDSSATGTDAIAIGMGAVANVNRSVALGDGAKTQVTAGTSGTTIGGNDYTFAGQAPVGTVSVGDVGAERTVTNVAAGRLSDTSTDAVNGSQLNATNKQVTLNTTDIATNTTNINRLTDDALQWDPAANGGNGAYNANHGGTGPNKITNVAAGDLSASSTDTVNGSQLFSTNNTITNLGNALTNIFETGTKYFHANSTGTDSVASGQDSVAIGMGAISSADGSVALGAGSVADGSTLSHQAYSVGGTATGEVNIGDRRITGLSAGADNADAVNVEQLKAVAAGAAASVADAVKYDDSTHNTITLGGSTYDNSTHTGGTTITNVADGVGDSDAVNMSQLNTTNNSVTSLGNALTNIYETGTKYFHANSTGTDSVASGQDSVAIGMGAISSADGSVALGAGSVADGSTLGHQAYSVGGTATGEVNIGDRRITGLSAGADNADAVNVEQLKAVAAGAAASVADAVKYDDSTHNTITLGGSTYDNSTHTGGTTITNVADGVGDSDAVNMSQLNQTNTQVTNNTTNINKLTNDALQWDSSLGAFSASHGGTTVNKITNVGAGDLSANSTDAVNGSQVYALGQQVTGIDNRVTNIEGNINSITNGGGIKYFRANSSGADSTASGAESIAMGPNAVASGGGSVASGNGANASGNGSVAMGNGAASSADGSVALGEGASDGGRGAETYTGKYSSASNSTSGTVSIGNAAAGENRSLSNVADGKQATDAVNLRQLDGAVAESKKYTDDSISTINTSVANQDARVTNVDNRVTQAVTNVTNLQNGTDGMFQANNTSKLAKPSATGEDSVAGGAGAKASGKHSSAVGSQAIAAGNNSTAMGNGSNAKADNSVALGANSVADRTNSVSVGAAGRERQITNVAAGTASTDAVNVSQLNSGLSDVTNKANAYTNSVYNSLHKDIKELDDDLSAGVAGAMAMAALPQPYTAGASMTSGSMGTYRGQSAMALGVSRISDNGRWVTKLQATTNTQRDFGASVGVGYQW
ncbi:YadA-like family protein [Pseudomonas sp. Irchel s3h17]|uniref:YadA-like family protein n=1 Tax=Pseudomonas sp. Irchel s3h17 TaxID=2009182 RepID=UPI000BA4A63B|nr:YadA-like family protein [Pseudomonas sp. Irchel s3h17]